MKFTTLVVYVISGIALFSITMDFMTAEPLHWGGHGEIEQSVLTMYAAIDNGHYEDLFNLSFEGKWGTKQDRANARSYYFDGIVSKDDFINQAQKDFGAHGWRVHFTSLAIRNLRSLTRAEFTSQYPREYAILQYVDRANAINTIYLANVKGYIVGNCAITDWEKELPIVWTGQKWKALIRGNPADFDPLHREQWFVNINFRYGTH